ncbi:glutamine synthetase family protein [Tropicimonas isoalkanivorans]|uniref:Glutamine synthetase n=1 Tax=Tropicimonas isoalkanivorans TaxID=441112 RepID=A0A1I1JMY1_9RHOB|nr:glutamine synthetase family protein [Tropicimonas isoalkanivorans]SFC46780.1 glutamine synthetase [Tropicimonas isoalkanivorans]
MPRFTTNWIGNLPQAFLTHLGDRRLEEVEAIIPDIVGMSRGKAMPHHKFKPDETFYLPISLFYQTISGEYVDMDIPDQWLEKDIVLRPDMTTATAVPWAEDATVQVICDLETREGEPLGIAPRNVLKRVLSFYAEQGWKPVVAPELEFYLTKPNTDPNEPIEPPLGRTGRKGASRQAFSMVAVDEYGEVIDMIYDYAEAQGLEIDTVIQEGGAGQIEINLMHDDPLKQADQVFYFKRTIREAALKNGVFATFMAKPMRDEPGSAMHIHQSVVDTKNRNIFSTKDGKETDAFHHFIGGSQKHLMSVVPLLAPYVNSFRRFNAEGMSAPTNLEWGSDNRTTGLRIPNSPPEARRVENRVIGIDCNPYLAIAASLACGYLGMMERIAPRPAAVHEVFQSDSRLPGDLGAALQLFDDEHPVRDVLGRDFCSLYSDIKHAEHDEYKREISPWERQHLLLNA